MHKTILLFCLGLTLAGSAAAQGYTKINHLGLRVADPLVIAVSTTVTNVFTANRSQTVGRVLVRTIQNTGTLPILYSIGTNSVTTTFYHGILAPGANTRDGLGSILNLSHIPLPVYLKTESGTSAIAVVEITQ